MLLDTHRLHAHCYNNIHNRDHRWIDSMAKVVHTAHTTHTFRTSKKLNLLARTSFFWFSHIEHGNSVHRRRQLTIWLDCFSLALHSHSGCSSLFSVFFRWSSTIASGQKPKVTHKKRLHCIREKLIKLLFIYICFIRSCVFYFHHLCLFPQRQLCFLFVFSFLLVSVVLFYSHSRVCSWYWQCFIIIFCSPCSCFNESMNWCVRTDRHWYHRAHRGHQDCVCCNIAYAQLFSFSFWNLLYENWITAFIWVK